jgi:hypothetical protein
MRTGLTAEAAEAMLMLGRKHLAGAKRNHVASTGIDG